MKKRWCIIYIEKPWPGWLHSDPMRTGGHGAAGARTRAHATTMRPHGRFLGAGDTWRTETLQTQKKYEYWCRSEF